MMLIWDLLLATFTISCVQCALAGMNGPTLNIKETSISYMPTHCLVDKATGTCRAMMRKYYFNIKSGQCEPFIYGGCGGNWNRFDTLSECHQTCTCKTPRETGPCRGHIRRWFYSPADGCCRPFIYGGCGGNSNNYATWTECSNLCGYPTSDSKWWQWGADWWNSNSQFNQTSGFDSGSSMVNMSQSETYSKNDFMRDWMLWRLLTGGEVDMEEIAILIAQAHMVGFGKATGPPGNPSPMQGPNPAATFRNAFGYFQSMSTEQEAASGGAGMMGGLSAFGGAGMMGGMSALGGAGMMGGMSALGGAGMMGGMSASGGAGMMGGMSASGGAGMMDGMANWGPAYTMSNPGSFTPLGQAGSTANEMQTLGLFDANGWGYGGDMAANAMNQWGSGQFGQGSQSVHGQVSSSSMGTQSSSGGGHMQNSWGQSSLQNLGNTKNGWAPHGESVIPTGSFNSHTNAAGSGQFGKGAWDGRFGERGVAMEFLYLISQLATGSLQPADLMGLAERFGAMQPNGNINIDALASRMVGSIKGPSGAKQLRHLKGIAKALGALDRNGNIDADMFISGLSKTIGSPDAFGNRFSGGTSAVAGGSWAEGRGTGGGSLSGSGSFAEGAGLRGGWQTSGGMGGAGFMGGKFSGSGSSSRVTGSSSGKKAYGKK